jgi:8-hydroxy-5-deazaflavin:NADPH oxidoreductase
MKMAWFRMIGSTTARLFGAAGHQVWIASSRGPESLAALAAEIGATAATTEEAIAAGDVFLLAIPLGCYRELPPAPLTARS